MNILLINHYAGSPKMGMEFRPYYLAERWVKDGHNVTILAANNSHLRKIDKELSTKIEEQEIDNINYIWVKTPKYSGNGISRVINIFTFIFRLFANLNYFAKKINPDVVIASSTYPIDNYFARKIANKTNAKHVYEVHDLWPLSPMELGNMSKYHPFIYLMQKGENFAYKKCDLVISMLPNTKEHMKEHGLDLNKWHYIPNGIVLNDWESPDKIPENHLTLLNKLKDDGKFIVGYTGGHAISNALHTLISAAKILKENSNIAFVFVGDGVEKDNLIKQAKGLDNIFFSDPVPKKTIPNLLEKFDTLCFGTNKSKIYKYGISMNKMMDYLMAAKPIVQYIDTINTAVEESGGGITVPTESPKLLAEAIIKISNLPLYNRNEMGIKGKEYILKNNEYDVLAKKFIKYISN